MNTFDQIVQSLKLDKLPGNRAELENDVIITYHPVGGGYEASLVIEYSDGGARPYHVTIYKSSWDGKVSIKDYSGEPVSIGPYCLHLTTNSGQRWFFQNIEDSWMYVTDYGEPKTAILNVFSELIGEVDCYF
ncbi:hypothetical protein [Agarilytica rhodophyticola]|uniref:hypothetical protein n=1 Tax=Agarilytica rhodophyticola TaxID=1737490 RepID=UPI000B346671|nr:hypothetical protein [Agarilytica rhodophyticola]